jgi:hypothetical protein
MLLMYFSSLLFFEFMIVCNIECNSSILLFRQPPKTHFLHTKNNKNKTTQPQNKKPKNKKPNTKPTQKQTPNTRPLFSPKYPPIIFTQIPAHYFHPNTRPLFSAFRYFRWVPPHNFTPTPQKHNQHNTPTPQKTKGCETQPLP